MACPRGSVTTHTSSRETWPERLASAGRCSPCRARVPPASADWSAARKCSVGARPLAGEDVLGEVAGWGLTNDACHITAPSRSGEGLRRAIEGALSRAALQPRDIHYVNGHGTATVYNDAMEARAVHDIFGSDGPPLSSMKGYFAHTLGAAGVVETALCLMSLRHRVVPACLGLHRLGVGHRVNVPREHLALRRLSHVLSFKSGFGGINAAVVLSAARRTP